MFAVLLIVGSSVAARINSAEVQAPGLASAHEKAGVAANDVKSIEILDSCTADDLAKLAAAYPNLEKLVIAPAAKVAGGKIPKGCFAKSNIQSVSLGSVTKIGRGAFQGCRNLVSVDAPSVVSVGPLAFDRCSKLVKVNVEKMTRLGRGAFQDCHALISFTVPAGVKELPDHAFQGCQSMTKLVIAGPVEAVSEEFLLGMPLLKEIYLPSTVKTCGHPGFAAGVKVELLRVPGYCPAGDSYDVPRYVTHVGDQVLKGCSGIKKIHVHSKVERIGTESFADMKDLSNVTFDEPSALVHIHDNAMADCPSLVTIKLPKSLTTVGKEIFRHSWQLRDIIIYDIFDTEWYSEGLVSETHAKLTEIVENPKAEYHSNIDKPYRSFPLRPPQKELTEEEKKPKHTSNKKPNIVFYFSDQQRWDTIGANGQKLDITPFLDQLCREGVNFAQFYSSQPVCGPLRSILQSGQYPTAIGTFKNAVPLPPELTHRLADQMKEAGYNLAYIGKWHLASDQGQIRYERDSVPLKYRGGWDQYWVAADVPEFTSFGYGGYVWDTDGNKREFSGYRVDAVTDYALEYIRNYEDTEKPFFLFLSHLEPHHQNNHGAFEGPVGSREMFKDFEPAPDLVNSPLTGDWRRWMPDYLGCCWSLDKNLGRVIALLKEKGIYDDTAIIYTTDHGCHFKVRSDVESGGSDDYKRTAYESALHIPLVIKGPGFEGGKTIEKLASTIDLPQTIVRMAGGEPGPEWKGRPLQECESDDWDNVVYVQVSESMVGRAIRTPEWSYVIHAQGKNPFNVPGSSDLTWTDKHLFDLKNDPCELNDLKDNPDYNEIKAQLRKILIRKAEEAGEGTFTIKDTNPLTNDL